MNFFDRAKLHVKNKNTTIESMIAEISNNEYTVDSYQGWHRREKIPKADICLKMADYLNISVRYLITGEENEYDAVQARFSKYKYLLEGIDKLPDDKFETIKMLVSVMSQKSGLEKNRIKKSGISKHGSLLL